MGREEKGGEGAKGWGSEEEGGLMGTSEGQHSWGLRKRGFRKPTKQRR